MNKLEKILKGLVKAELIGLVVVAIWGYGKANYYKGRVDFAREIEAPLSRIKSTLENAETRTEES